MKYTKNVFLKNNQKCLLRNAVGDDAQEVLNIFLLTHEQTDFLASYKDETSFDTAFEKQFLAEKEHADREVYLCAVVDGRIVGTANVDSVGENKVRHRAELGIAVDRAFWGSPSSVLLRLLPFREYILVQPHQNFCCEPWGLGWA